MVRKFLYVIAFLIVLAIGARIAWEVYEEDLIRWYTVPEIAFVEQAPVAANAYADKALWFSRPGLTKANATRWTPDGYKPSDATQIAIFYVHPTSYLKKDHWNAPLDDKESQDRARIFLRSQASVFNGLGVIWAPRYRQATFGVFLTDVEEANRALDAAYADVLAAFDQFVSEIGPDTPIIIAGHSQGSLHLTRLMKDRVGGKPLASRIIAAYPVGWPVSTTRDVAAMGLPVCNDPAQTGCLLSWQAFAEPADTHLITNVYDSTIGFDGKSREKTPMVCINPLTGTANATAAMDLNKGTLKPNADLTDGELIAGAVPARCDERGFLLIGDPPKMGQYVLPGNNYHVYDYPLFWVNVREDAERRTAAFLQR